MFHCFLPNEEIMVFAVMRLDHGRSLEPVEIQFSRRLRELRIVRGFAKARHFAAALGISENRYTRYERGDAEPSLDMLRRFCSVLNSTPNELLGVGEARPAQPMVNVVGMAESGTSFERQPDTSPGHPVHSPGDKIPDIDAAAWKLARVFVRFGWNGDPASPRTGTEALTELRSIAACFEELSADPYRTIARFVKAPTHVSASADAQTALNSEIHGFIALLDASSDVKP